MQRLPFYQIDAFAGQAFHGNPAAVMPLDGCEALGQKDSGGQLHWPADELLQAIASENNLSETAFLLPLSKSSPTDCDFHLRWFTPVSEVRLCGHATFASAHWFFHEAPDAVRQQADIVRFQTLSGVLTVGLTEAGMTMSLASEMPSPLDITDEQLAVLGLKPEQVEYAGAGVEYLQVVVGNEALVRSLEPDLVAMKSLEYGGVIVTAQAFDQDYDFVGRFFAPRFGIDEDPVTGSAFAVMAPYWMDRLGQARLTGYQASERGGFVVCQAEEDRILMTGQAVTVIQGQFILR